MHVDIYGRRRRGIYLYDLLSSLLNRRSNVFRGLEQQNKHGRDYSASLAEYGRQHSLCHSEFAYGSVQGGMRFVAFSLKDGLHSR